MWTGGGSYSYKLFSSDPRLVQIQFGGAGQFHSASGLFTGYDSMSGGIFKRGEQLGAQTRTRSDKFVGKIQARGGQTDSKDPALSKNNSNSNSDDDILLYFRINLVDCRSLKELII